MRVPDACSVSGGSLSWRDFKTKKATSGQNVPALNLNPRAASFQPGIAHPVAVASADGADADGSPASTARKPLRNLITANNGRKLVVATDSTTQCAPARASSDAAAGWASRIAAAIATAPRGGDRGSSKPKRARSVSTEEEDDDEGSDDADSEVSAALPRVTRRIAQEFDIPAVELTEVQGGKLVAEPQSTESRARRTFAGRTTYKDDDPDTDDELKYAGAETSNSEAWDEIDSGGNEFDPLEETRKRQREVERAQRGRRRPSTITQSARKMGGKSAEERAKHGRRRVTRHSILPEAGFGSGYNQPVQGFGNEAAISERSGAIVKTAHTLSGDVYREEVTPAAKYSEPSGGMCSRQSDHPTTKKPLLDDSDSEDTDLSESPGQTAAPKHQRSATTAAPAQPELAHRVAMWKLATGTEGDMGLQVGDHISVNKFDNDEWWSGTNCRTGQQGFFPIIYTQAEDGPSPLLTLQPAMKKQDKAGDEAGAHESTGAKIYVPRSRMAQLDGNGSDDDMYGGLVPMDERKDESFPSAPEKHKKFDESDSKNDERYYRPSRRGPSFFHRGPSYHSSQSVAEMSDTSIPNNGQKKPAEAREHRGRASSPPKQVRAHSSMAGSEYGASEVYAASHLHQSDPVSTSSSGCASSHQRPLSNGPEKWQSAHLASKVFSSAIAALPGQVEANYAGDLYQESTSVPKQQPVIVSRGSPPAVPRNRPVTIVKRQPSSSPDARPANRRAPGHSQSSSAAPPLQAEASDVVTVSQNSAAAAEQEPADVTRGSSPLSPIGPPFSSLSPIGPEGTPNTQTTNMDEAQATIYSNEDITRVQEDIDKLMADLLPKEKMAYKRIKDKVSKVEARTECLDICEVLIEMRQKLRVMRIEYSKDDTSFEHDLTEQEMADPAGETRVEKATKEIQRLEKRNGVLDKKIAELVPTLSINARKSAWRSVHRMEYRKLRNEDEMRRLRGAICVRPYVEQLAKKARAYRRDCTRLAKLDSKLNSVGGGKGVDRLVTDIPKAYKKLQAQKAKLAEDQDATEGSDPEAFYSEDEERMAGEAPSIEDVIRKPDPGKELDIMTLGAAFEGRKTRSAKVTDAPLTSSHMDHLKDVHNDGSEKKRASDGSIDQTPARKKVKRINNRATMLEIDDADDCTPQPSRGRQSMATSTAGRMFPNLNLNETGNKSSMAPRIIRGLGIRSRSRSVAKSEPERYQQHRKSTGNASDHDAPGMMRDLSIRSKNPSAAGIEQGRHSSRASDGDATIIIKDSSTSSKNQSVVGTGSERHQQRGRESTANASDHGAPRIIRGLSIRRRSRSVVRPEPRRSQQHRCDPTANTSDRDASGMMRDSTICSKSPSGAGIEPGRRQTGNIPSINALEPPVAQPAKGKKGVAQTRKKTKPKPTTFYLSDDADNYVQTQKLPTSARSRRAERRNEDFDFLERPPSMQGTTGSKKPQSKASLRTASSLRTTIVKPNRRELDLFGGPEDSSEDDEIPLAKTAEDGKGKRTISQASISNTKSSRNATSKKGRGNAGAGMRGRDVYDVSISPENAGRAQDHRAVRISPDDEDELSSLESHDSNEDDPRHDITPPEPVTSCVRFETYISTCKQRAITASAEDDDADEHPARRNTSATSSARGVRRSSRDLAASKHYAEPPISPVEDDEYNQPAWRKDFVRRSERVVRRSSRETAASKSYHEPPTSPVGGYEDAEEMTYEYEGMTSQRDPSPRVDEQIEWLDGDEDEFDRLAAKREKYMRPASSRTAPVGRKASGRIELELDENGMVVDGEKIAPRPLKDFRNTGFAIMEPSVYLEEILKKESIGVYAHALLTKLWIESQQAYLVELVNEQLIFPGANGNWKSITWNPLMRKFNDRFEGVVAPKGSKLAWPFHDGMRKLSRDRVGEAMTWLEMKRRAYEISEWKPGSSFRARGPSERTFIDYIRRGEETPPGDPDQYDQYSSELSSCDEEEADKENDGPRPDHQRPSTSAPRTALGELTDGSSSPRPKGAASKRTRAGRENLELAKYPSHQPKGLELFRASPKAV